MAKAKKKPVSRVSPPVLKTNVKFTVYQDLNNGDAFLMDGELWIKMDVCDQEAFNLDTGRDIDCLCDKVVEPVNITVKWTRK